MASSTNHEHWTGEKNAGGNRLYPAWYAPVTHNLLPHKHTLAMCFATKADDCLLLSLHPVKGGMCLGFMGRCFGVDLVISFNLACKGQFYAWEAICWMVRQDARGRQGAWNSGGSAGIRRGRRCTKIMAQAFSLSLVLCV